MRNSRYIKTDLSFVHKFIAVTAGLSICLAIFSFIPALNYHQFILQTNIRRVYVTDVVRQADLQKEPEKPRQSEQMKPDAKAHKAPSKGKAPKAANRFAMDVGPATSLSGRTGGVSMSLGDAEGQTSYSQGETDTDAKLLRSTPPKYPKSALDAGVHGLVRCLLTIGENGRIMGVQFLETPGEYGFRESIEEALQQWIFEPATIDGIPVRQKLEQPFKF